MLGSRAGGGGGARAGGRGEASGGGERLGEVRGGARQRCGVKTAHSPSQPSAAAPTDAMPYRAPESVCVASGRRRGHPAAAVRDACACACGPVVDSALAPPSSSPSPRCERPRLAVQYFVSAGRAAGGPPSGQPVGPHREWYPAAPRGQRRRPAAGPTRAGRLRRGPGGGLFPPSLSRPDRERNYAAWARGG